jgi:hypothetical protein
MLTKGLITIIKKANPKRGLRTGIHQTAFSTMGQHTEKVMLCKEHEMLRGYKLGLQQVAVNLKVWRELGKEGFQSTQRARLYLCLWHPWLPRKVFTRIMAHFH